MLIPIGLLFVLVGLAVGISTALTGTSPHLLFTFGFLLMMPLMGGIMAGVAYWYRARKSRVLSDGTLLLGTIASVAHSNLSVDEQVQHIVSIRYPNEAEERSRRTVTCAAYSLGAEEAQRRHKNREAVRLLVDPKDPKHVVCVDFITLFD